MNFDHEFNLDRERAALRRLSEREGWGRLEPFPWRLLDLYLAGGIDQSAFTERDADLARKLEAGTALPVALTGRSRGASVTLALRWSCGEYRINRRQYQLPRRDPAPCGLALDPLP